MIVLSLDTALAACQGALVRDGQPLALASEAMDRGHQERLAPLVAELFAAAGIAPSAVDRVVVTLGPGSFTGLRVGVAFAKGVAIGLGKPLVGVGTLEALAAEVSGRSAAVIAAPHGRVYLQRFQDGRPVSEPNIALVEDALARLRAEPVDVLIGPAAATLVEALPGVMVQPLAWPDPVRLARLGAAAPVMPGPLRPLYLREPDARTIAERAALKAAAAALAP